MLGSKRLVGFYNLKELLAELKKEERAYQVCRLPLPHLLMELERGNGQTYLTEYITQFFAENDLRSFGSMDNYLEYQLDGSLKQIHQMFMDIRANAVYSPRFEGVIAMDVTALGQVVNEEQMEVFVKEMTSIMYSATVILFLSPKCMNKQTLKKVLVEKLRIKEIEVLLYSKEDYLRIMALKLRELGVKIHEPQKQKERLLCLVEQSDLYNAGDAVCLAEKLAFKADYSGFVPMLFESGTEEVLQSTKDWVAV